MSTPGGKLALVAERIDAGDEARDLDHGVERVDAARRHPAARRLRRGWSASCRASGRSRWARNARPRRAARRRSGRRGCGSSSRRTRAAWRRLNPMPSVTPAARHASIAFSAVLRVSVIGFSTKTCLPAFAAWTICFMCSECGVASIDGVDLGVLQHPAVGRDNLDAGFLRELLVFRGIARDPLHELDLARSPAPTRPGGCPTAPVRKSPPSTCRSPWFTHSRPQR